MAMAPTKPIMANVRGERVGHGFDTAGQFMRDLNMQGTLRTTWRKESKGRRSDPASGEGLSGVGMRHDDEQQD